MVESYVVVHNVAKRHNIGTMARSATAFGVAEFILVGRRDFNSFGSHGSTPYLHFRQFHSLSETRLYLKEKDCDICGVEIVDGAIPVNHQPFKKSTAFLLGNWPLTKECEICDFFVYIPQYGCGTASLNVTVAASIVLHQFGVWAGFPERGRDGQKFTVAEKPMKLERRNYCAENAEDKMEERKFKRENASHHWFDEQNANHSSVDSQSSTLALLFEG
ncbi:hypothetical protein AMTR_s00019p00254850 [Amborella trichopoda]|uniref:tRNA/rRNA methyltransferase SpoU type domain-containing protein n=1 Tax=Amborella trichopoda TaxID=13333 RepID=W1PHK6_AMBTC|nr:hypothetical protein AMTR_s00019p00254850 [Amborella trichopoda]